MLERLDGEGIRSWCVTALRRLRAAADELNRLNVYPVRDSDTGANLVATVQYLCHGLPAGPAALPDVLAAMARSALMGANGNSGTILSQLLRGVAEAGEGAEALDGGRLAAGLGRGAELAYQAVGAPVEGTILTVARAAAEAAAEAAGECAGTGDLAAVVRAASGAARAALARTPEQLPELAAAGVVDAGGRGWCVLLDALVETVEGGAGAPAAEDPPMLVPRDPARPTVARESGDPGYGYEVQYLLDADEEAVATLRETLGRLGDSLVVVGADGLWNVHVHVNDVGAAVEAGVVAGRPHRITVTRFADQVAEAAPDRATPTGRGAGRVVVAVTGPGVAELVTAAGALAVELPPAHAAAADDRRERLLAAVRDAGPAQVALLPTDRATAEAATDVVAAARAEGRTVAVVPARSVVQGIAALAVHDADRPFADDVIAMTSAAAATRSVEITAVEGAVHGLVDGSLAVSGTDPFAVAAELLDRLLVGGGDLVTVVTGEAGADLGRRLAARLATASPTVEVHLHHGGQPEPMLVAGVE